MNEIPEGRGTFPAGALDSVSPLEAARGATPASAVAGRVVHCKREPFDVYIGRPSKFGNPFRVMGEHTRAAVIEAFERRARAIIERDPKAAAEIKALYGKTLACWCAPKACHGDVLLKLAAELVALDRVDGQNDHG